MVIFYVMTSERFFSVFTMPITQVRKPAIILEISRLYRNRSILDPESLLRDFLFIAARSKVAFSQGLNRLLSASEFEEVDVDIP